MNKMTCDFCKSEIGSEVKVYVGIDIYFAKCLAFKACDACASHFPNAIEVKNIFALLRCKDTNVRVFAPAIMHIPYVAVPNIYFVDRSEMENKLDAAPYCSCCQMQERAIVSVHGWNFCLKCLCEFSPLDEYKELSIDSLCETSLRAWRSCVMSDGDMQIEGMVSSNVVYYRGSIYSVALIKRATAELVGFHVTTDLEMAWIKVHGTGVAHKCKTGALITTIEVLQS